MGGTPSTASAALLEVRSAGTPTLPLFYRSKSSGFALAFALAFATAAFAAEQYAPPPMIPPPNAAAISNNSPKPVQEYDYTPRIRGQAVPPQIVPDKKQIIDKFKEAYAKQNKPKLLVYINRELIAPEHQKKHEGVTETRITIREEYGERKPRPAPADEKELSKERINKQIMTREIEDSFGAPYRDGGGIFVDQKIASLMNGAILHGDAKPGSKEAADAEAIKKNADIVVELMLDERTFPASDIAGDHEVVLPVMTATAIRLNDSQIVAQVTSMGLFGLDSKDPNVNATSLMVQMSPSQIAQEMAFALMRDLNHAWGEKSN